MTTTAIKIGKIKEMGRLKELRVVKPLGANPTSDEQSSHDIDLANWYAELNELYKLCLAQERAEMALKSLKDDFPQPPAFGPK